MTDQKTRPSRRALVRGAAWAAPVSVAAISAPAMALSLTDCLSMDLPVGARTTMSWDSEWTETVNPSDFVAGSGDLAGPPANWAPSTSSRCNNGREVASVTGVTNAKNGQRDPRVNGAQFSYDRVLCLSPGTYQIRYWAASYRGNPVTAYMSPSVRNASGQTISTTLIPSGPANQAVTSHGFVNPATGTGTNANYSQTNMARTQFGFQFTVAQQGRYGFRFVWSFGRISTDSANSGRLTQNPSQGDQCLPTFANDIAVEAPVIRRAA